MILMMFLIFIKKIEEIPVRGKKFNITVIHFVI